MEKRKRKFTQKVSKGVRPQFLNIGIIIPFLEKYGGAERYLIECVEKWQERHHITLYATRFNDNLLAEHGISDEVRRVSLSPYFEGEHSMLLNALLLPQIWRKEIGVHDLYHMHLWPTHLIDLHPMVWFPHEPLRVLHDLRYEQNVDYVGKEAARNIHVYPKYNYDRIGDVTYEAYLGAINLMDKAVLPDRIVANSQYTAGYLSEVYGVDVHDVVYPGCDLDIHIDLPKDRNLFVTISQLWAHKRVQLLIEAVAQTDDAQLVVIGSGPEKERLVEMSEGLGVSDRVFFLSGLSNRELALVLARANAFLFCPIKEPFGIVVLEALAAGLPVIAVDEGGYVEICKPEFAFLVRPYPSDFADRMRYLQQHADVARKMGELGKVAARQYTWHRAADELESLLVETHLASDRRRSPQAVEVDRPLVGVQYYLWYGEGFGAPHWNDDAVGGHVSDKPLLGYYGSVKGLTIREHLSCFESMGLDYVIMNLHFDHSGVNGLELMGIQHVFDVAERSHSPLRFAVQLAPYSDDLDALKKAVRMLAKLYADRSNYLRLDGKPVLFWFWSSAYDGNKAFLDELRSECASFVNLAASLRIPAGREEDKLTFGFFDGFVPFSPLELSASDKWQTVWTSAYQAAERAGMPYRMAALSPGYDDTGLTAANRVGNPYRVVARDGGAVYQTGMKFVENLRQRPHLVMISTFNEFHENTHIEPTQRHGDFYVKMTTAFVERLKRKWGGA